MLPRIWSSTPKSGPQALAVPPLKLADLTAAGDPRAEALWYRTGDNSIDNGGVCGYEQLNAYARNADRWPDAKLDAYLADIADAMRHSRIRRPITVWRGVNLTRRFGREFGELTGVEWVDPAPVSATVDPDVAKLYSFAVCRLHIRRGVGVITLADRPHDTPAQEVLIEAGAHYRVTAEHVERDDRGRVCGHSTDVEVTPAGDTSEPEPAADEDTCIPGWYEDPEYEGYLRYWSGTAWVSAPVPPEDVLDQD